MNNFTLFFILSLSFSVIFSNDPISESDYLIITHSDLVGTSSWVDDLTDLQSSRGYYVGVYTISDGESNTDIQAYIQSAYITGVQIKYILLVGAASIEVNGSPSLPGGKFIEEGSNRVSNDASAYDLNFVPFMFENMFGWSDYIDIPTDDLYLPGFGSTNAVSIGRIPAISTTDIESYVTKLENYYYNISSYGDWKKKEIFLNQNMNDPWNNNPGDAIDYQVNRVIENISTQITLQHLNSSDIDPTDPWYADGTKSELMEDAFVNAINDGGGIFHYFGTGAESVSLGNFYWQEDVFIGPTYVGSNYSELTNSNSYPIMLANSCNLGEIQRPFSMLRRNLLRDLIFLEGGFIGVIAPTIYSSHYASREFSIDQHKYLFDENDQIRTLGDLTIFTKNRFEDRRPSKLWHSRGIILYGDPSMPPPIYQPRTSDVLSNETWSGNILIPNDIEVDAGVTLTIKQGTGIFFKEDAGLTVNGDLVFEGSEIFPIVLAAASEAPVTMGYWDGLNISENSIVNFDHVIIRDADEIVFQSLSSSESAISNSSFINNSSVKINGGNVHFENCSFEDNQYGLIVLAMNTPLCNPVIENCEFINNTYGVSTIYNSQPIIFDTNFIDNTVGLFSTLNSTPNLLASSFDCNGSNNIFTNNDYGVQTMVGSAPWLGIYTPGMEFGSGYNRIYGNSVFNVYNNSGTGTPIYAQKNHWQNDTQNLCESGDPTGTLNGDIIWDPTISGASRDIEITPLHLEITGENAAAIESYISLIESNPDSNNIGWAISGIVRCYENLGTLDDLYLLLNQFENDYVGTNTNLYSRAFQATQFIKSGDYETALNIINLINIEQPYGNLFFKHLFEQILISQLESEGGSMGRMSETGLLLLDEMYIRFPGSSAVDLVANIFKVESILNEIISTEQTTVIIGIPTEFKLQLPFPNPFNPLTTLRYDLPENGHVSLIVYDMMGREVTQLVNSYMNAGYHSIQWDATSFASGVYMVKLVVGDFTQTQKIALVK